MKIFGDTDEVLFVFESCIPVVGNVAANPIAFGLYNGPLRGDVAILLFHQAV